MEDHWKNQIILKSVKLDVQLVWTSDSCDRVITATSGIHMFSDGFFKPCSVCANLCVQMCVCKRDFRQIQPCLMYSSAAFVLLLCCCLRQGLSHRDWPVIHCVFQSDWIYGSPPASASQVLGLQIDMNHAIPIIKNSVLSQAWWCLPLVPALRMPR